MQFALRAYETRDAAAVNALALAAFAQYRALYPEWTAFEQVLANAAVLANQGEMIVAEAARGLVGAVTFVGPGLPKDAMFEPAWAVLRLLIVDPAARGGGVGRTLVEECVRRSLRDGASVVALHTSDLMQVALRLYRRMGFAYFRASPPIFGVPYAVYIKQLDA